MVESLRMYIYHPSSVLPFTNAPSRCAYMELRLLLAPAAEEQNALVSCSHGDRKSCNLADGMGHLLNVVITARPSSCLLRHWTVLRAPEVKQLRHIHVIPQMYFAARHSTRQHLGSFSTVTLFSTLLLVSLSTWQC